MNSEIKLGDLLNEKQAKEVVRILKSSADSIERVRRLKDYFGTFREDLEKKGVLPEYLVYQVEYLNIQKGRRDSYFGYPCPRSSDAFGSLS